MTSKNLAMRKRSGEVSSHDALACFLYVLARDELPVGKIEAVIDTYDPKRPEVGYGFTNGWLGRWALDASARLRHDL